MTDGSDSKPPSIPAWQTTNSHTDTSKNAAQAVPAQEDRSAVLDQARIFLDDASVRDAPRERKLAFLAKKGLQNDEIQRLLDTSSSETASSSGQDDGLKTLHDSSASSSPASHVSATTTSQSSSSQPQSASQTNRDIPPIITYPEFLLRPSKPPPLITLERLTYSLYTLAGISALTYGASKYLVQPMLQSLTSSRHDLASTALHNLEKLNEKLQGSVSHIPATSHSTITKQRFHDKDSNNEETASDIETADSDPTELFHRDMATQTLPRLLPRSPSLSTTSSTRSSPHGKESEDTPTTTQLTHLTTLKASLTSLLQTESPQPTNHLLSTLSSTQSYLDKLQFSPNPYTDYHHLLLHGSTLPASAAANQGRNAVGVVGGGEGGGGKGPSDEARKFRQEILSLKGALLSVRSFPLGGKATTATATATATVPGGAGGVR